ncbi:MAG: hypothetical protein V1813_03105 [Candidatus Aenigmatarchaeota archaeon]
MVIPFWKKRLLQRKMKDASAGMHARAGRLPRKLPSIRYGLRLLWLRERKLSRIAKYASEDAYYALRRILSHTESLLFCALIILAGAMLLSSRAGSFLDSLVAFLLLVLIVVLYGQLKMQRRMLAQYVPMVDFVRVNKCFLYSERIRAQNVFGVMENLGKARKVRNVRIGYDVVNDSFCPVSIEGAALTIKIRKGGKITLPPAVSVLDLPPKKSGGTTVEFRLPEEVFFDTIEWMEVDLRGNCRKTVRVKPHLYVNAILRGREQKLIFEPYEAFLKRPELQLHGEMPESK